MPWILSANGETTGDEAVWVSDRSEPSDSDSGRIQSRGVGVVAVSLSGDDGRPNQRRKNDRFFCNCGVGGVEDCSGMTLREGAVECFGTILLYMLSRYDCPSGMLLKDISRSSTIESRVTLS